MFQRLFLTLLTVAAVAAELCASPKYVFLFIGDGMGTGHVMAAENYRRMVLGEREPMLMLTFPTTGLMSTYSASSPVTDSAAAGTALACGRKTANRMIGITPDGEKPESMASIFHRNGYGVGLVTTVAPDDATPAAFYAHVVDRSQFDEIARDAMEADFEFLAGANLRGRRDNYDRFRENGIAVVRGGEECGRVASRRVLLLNTDTVLPNDVGYALDSTPGALTLPDITRLCIDHLMRHTPERFFIMAEGGSIDHAAHSNDGAAVIKEILDFNNALAVAYDFYLRHPDDTVIIVTSDHDTGGMATVSNGGSLAEVDRQRISKDRFNDWCKQLGARGKAMEWDKMSEVLADKFGIGKSVALTSAEMQRLRESFEGSFNSQDSASHVTTYASYSDFVDTLYDILDSRMSIRWITNEHTANPVGVYAIGRGTEALGHFIDNTEIYTFLTRGLVPEAVAAAQSGVIQSCTPMK